MKIRLLFLAAACASRLAAQDVMHQDMTIELSPTGDASMKAEFQLTASKWERWKTEYGDHPDLLKRNLSHYNSQAEISDFDFKRDDINRRATASMKAYGQAVYKGGGRYEAPIVPGARKVSENGREITFNLTQPSDTGGIFEVTSRIILPQGSTQIGLTTGAGGRQLLSYTVPVRSGNGLWLALAIISGALLMLLTLLRLLVRPQMKTITIIPEPPAKTPEPPPLPGKD